MKASEAIEEKFLEALRVINLKDFSKGFLDYWRYIERT